MADMNVSKAASAYQNAMRAAEKIVEETSLPSSPQAEEVGKPSFKALVGEALDTARDTGYKAEAISTRGLAGKADLTEVVAAVGNAETALNTVVTVRDRVINAYQDIIKMPI